MFERESKWTMNTLVIVAAACCAYLLVLPTSEVAAESGSGAASNLCVDDWLPKGHQFQTDNCRLANGKNPPVTPILWEDVCFPKGTGWTPTQSSFDQLSWRSFLYLSWPATPSGEPDKAKKIGVQEGGAFQPTVWQTFKTAKEVLAGDLDSLEVPNGCDPQGPPVLSMTSKVRDASIAALMAGADGSPMDGINQARRGPLYPQGPEPRLPVYYEIRVNEKVDQSVISQEAWRKTPKELNCDKVSDPESCEKFEFLMGSTEIKAAWKVLSDEEVRSGEFFHQKRQVVDPSKGHCLTRDVGLVGLHIARKVQSALPGDERYKRTHSWSWATFEHRRNVPPVGSAGDGGHYSFYNATCTPAVDVSKCEEIHREIEKNKKANPDEAYRCCENLWRYKNFTVGNAPKDPTPNQVTRLDKTQSETQACNEIYDPLEKGVFDNYLLIVTQWPKQHEDQSEEPTRVPEFARNTVIETFKTKWVDSVNQVSASNCMGCHGGSPAVEMSFLFLPNGKTNKE